MIGFGKFRVRIPRNLPSLARIECKIPCIAIIGWLTTTSL
jgi:hypothetical protein